MKKKLLSVCFILAAVLSLMTVTALAAGAEGVEEVEPGKAIAQVDDHYYGSLEDAVKAAEPGKTITLLGHIYAPDDNVDLFITIDKDLTINLNKKTVNLRSGSITVVGAALTIKDGTIESSYNQTVDLGSKGVLTVQDGATIKNTRSSGVGVRISKANGKLTLSSGAIEATGSNGCAINQSSMGEIIIEDGTITGSTGIAATAGTVAIGGDASKTPIIKGIITGTGSAKVEIKGGIFSRDVSNSGFVDKDYEAIKVGNYWLVVHKETQTKVAVVVHADGSDPEICTTLGDAIGAAKDGDTVWLVKDADAGSDPVNAKITLELGGYTISGTLNLGADAAISSTIKGGSVAISDAGVTIKGCTITGGANAVQVKSGATTIDSTTITGGVAVSGEDTSATIKGSTITGTADGISVSGGSLTVESSTITGTTNGISVSAGSLTVNGSTTTTMIKGTGTNGVAVSGENASAAIKGGFIEGAANGIVVSSKSSLTVEGGSIKGATNGVEVKDGGSLTVQSTAAAIEGAGTNGVGITVSGDGTSATINGGIITGAVNGISVSAKGSLIVNGTNANAARVTGRTGIGVAVSGEGTSATINNGTVEGAANGVEVSSQGSLTVGGGIITGAANGVEVKGGGSLTVEGTTATSITGTGTGGVGITVSGTGTSAAVTNGTIEGAANGVAVSDQGSLTVGGGSITGTTNGVEVKGGGSLTVEGTTARIAGNGADGVGITVSGANTSATVTGGAITGTTVGAAVSDQGSLTVEGGGITGGTKGVSVNNAKLTVGIEGADNGIITISGSTALYFEGTFTSEAVKIYSGTFKSNDPNNGKSVDVAEGSTLSEFIYGGRFTNNANNKDPLPRSYLAADKKRTQNSDGTVVVVEGDVVEITINLNGGTLEADSEYKLTIVKGATLSAKDMPANPTRPGYAFDGWYTEQEGGERFKFDEWTIETDTTIYAHWKQVFTITFDAGEEGQFGKNKYPPERYDLRRAIEGRTLSESKGDLPDDPGSGTGVPDDPVPRTGVQFVFGGWYTEVTGGDRIDLATYKFTNDAESKVKVDQGGKATLYARWGYEITFDLNDGVSKDAYDRKVTDRNGDLTEWPKAPERDGYRFDGWFKDPEQAGDGRVDTGAAFNVDKATRLYAHWTRKVPVTLTAEPKELTSEETGPKITLTVTGAKFIDNVAKEQFTLTMGDKEIDGVTVDIDPEGNTEDNTKVTIILNKAPREAGTLIIKVGGDAFQSPPTKDNATVSVDVTYEITFLEDDETKLEGKNTANTDINGKLSSLPIPTHTGDDAYAFLGWFIGEAEGDTCNKDGTCIEVTVGEEATVFTKNTKVHAHWDQLSFTVTFNANGGAFEGGGNTRTATTNDQGMLKQADLNTIPTYADHTFDGWYTAEGKAVTIDTVFKKDDTVYAHWIAKSCTITFLANGGSFEDGTASKEVPIDGNTTLSEKQLAAPDNSPAGYAFAGWFIGNEDGTCKEEGGTGEDSKCKEVTTDTVFKNDTKVHAHWGYEITFYLNDGTSEDEYSKPVTGRDGRLTKWPAEPKRDGYVFTGWYDDPANGTQVDVEGYKFKKATLVYAHWSQSVALTASPTELLLGGTAKEITLKITTDDVTFVSGADKSLFTLSGAAAEGLSVEDAVRSADGKEVKITLNKAPSAVGTLTITVDGSALSPRRAQAASVDIAVKCTVTFDLNYDGAPESTTATTDKDGKLSTLPTPTRDGYTFDGWFTAATGGTKIEDGHLFTANTTLYAHWTKKSASDPEDPGTEDPSGPSTPDDKKGTYYIRIDSGMRHGSVYTDPGRSSAEEGSTVQLSVKPDGDYTVSSVEIRPATGSSIWRYPTGGTCSFVMPASDVTIYATFSLRPEYNNFVPPQTQSQYQAQASAQAKLPASAFTPVTWRPAAAMWDVPASSWAYPAAQWAYQNGYLDTAADGTFRLNDTVSHIQLWRIMARWLGEPSLDDNSVTQWARKSGATRIGSASGAMTRQNMVEYLYQCYFLMGGDVSVTGNLMQYRDGQQVTAGSARNAWLWAVNKGIISGTPDGALNPNGILSRGEFAAILMRMCQIR